MLAESSNSSSSHVSVPRGLRYSRELKELIIERRNSFNSTERRDLSKRVTHQVRKES